MRCKRRFLGQIFDLSRVKILPETLVHRVILERKNGELVTIGVELVNGHHVSPSREIIVSVGVYHSPKILMLSGIGGRPVLEKHSLPALIILKSARFFS